MLMPQSYSFQPHQDAPSFVWNHPTQPYKIQQIPTKNHKSTKINTRL